MGRLTGLEITTSNTSNFIFRAERKRDERSAPEIGAIKRSKSDDSQIVVANAEHELDSFNLCALLSKGQFYIIRECVLSRY